MIVIKEKIEQKKSKKEQNVSVSCSLAYDR